MKRRNVIKIGLLAAMLLPVCTLSAQQKTPPSAEKQGAASANTPYMQINLEMQGDFTSRFVTKSGDAKAPAPLPPSMNGAVLLNFPSDLKVEDTLLEIYDNTRGNIARLPVNIKTQTSVTETSFKYVRAVYVPVMSKGRPVTDVQVSLANANRSFSKTLILNAGDNGVARFESVPLDEPITVTVSYASNKPTSLTESLTRAHQSDGHHRAAINVDWADVKTLAAVAPVSPSASNSASPSSSASAQPAKEPSGGNGIINTLFGIAFVGGVGYFVYRAYEQGKIKTFLEKAGIQTEQPVDTGVPANPFAKPEMPPIQPITEGTADPFSGGTAFGSPIAGITTAPVAQGPRLVGTIGSYSGAIFPLNSASMVMGRDASNPIPLPDDTNASRRHATVTVSNGQFAVADNGSSNGTFVNGVKIQSGFPHPLRAGDEIQVGMTRFRLET